MDSKWIVSLQGKEHPLYGGVLALAHEMGLLGIEVDLVQIPTDENGQTAIARATVRMAGDAVFADYGDASPRNTNARIATALIRMASTRAKGRALRDAVNIGETLAEEIPNEDSYPSAARFSAVDSTQPPPRMQPSPVPQSAAAAGDPVLLPVAPAAACRICDKPLAPARLAFCDHHKLEYTHQDCAGERVMR